MGEEVRLELLQCVRRGAVEVDAEIFTGGRFTKEEHGRGSANAVFKTGFVEIIETPAYGLAIWADEIKGIELGAEGKVVRRLEKNRHRGKVDKRRLVVFCSADQDVDDLSVSSGGDLDAEEVIFPRPSDWFVSTETTWII